MVYFARRIGFFIVTLWAAVTLNFLIPRLIPGDPAEQIVRQIAGQSSSVDPAQVRAVQVMLGLDTEQTLLQQYLTYMQNTLRGDFGVSYTYFPYTVTHMIGETLPWTLALIGITTVFGFIVGTLLGAYAAWRRNTRFDATVSIGSTFIGTLPFFWIALALVFIFAIQLRWLPTGGGFSGDVDQGWNWPFIRSVIEHAILPGSALLILSPIGWIMTMRNNMVQILGDDYTRLARAKGLPERRIAVWYGARNAILPQVTAFALALGGLIGGSIFVEQIFDYPGTGRLLFEALGVRDYPLMQTIFLFTVIGVLIANLFADILYGILDPRVRRGST
ncbi:MAG TPA: ABC transporter permease [Thermomicrobiales bacterium]|jgi:peptide/nickel transport system permease protein|nr:ABC transporter permease [Thermomicrobiales bacterium]